MSRPTLTSLYDKLTVVENELKKLEASKVGTETWQFQHQQIKDDIADVKEEIAVWRFYARWAVLIIVGAVLTALMGLVIKK